MVSGLTIAVPPSALTVSGGCPLCGNSSGPGFTHHTSSGNHETSMIPTAGVCRPSSAASLDYHAHHCGCAAYTYQHSGRSISSSSHQIGLPFRYSLSSASPSSYLAIKYTNTTICEQRHLPPLPTGRPRTRLLVRLTPNRPKSAVLPRSPSRTATSPRKALSAKRSMLLTAASARGRVICIP